jgi:hypothetical protein
MQTCGMVLAQDATEVYQRPMHSSVPRHESGAPSEILAGTIGRLTFHNVENGFCVLRVKARGRRDLITVVGHAASISAGEWVTATGEWVNDRTHGPQFRARFHRASAPTMAEGIQRYLASGMIRGIGPGSAKRLVRALSRQRQWRRTDGAGSKHGIVLVLRVASARPSGQSTLRMRAFSHIWHRVSAAVSRRPRHRLRCLLRLSEPD